jgi:hypothetical protein
MINCIRCIGAIEPGRKLVTALRYNFHAERSNRLFAGQLIGRLRDTGRLESRDACGEGFLVTPPRHGVANPSSPAVIRENRTLAARQGKSAGARNSVWR